MSEEKSHLSDEYVNRIADTMPLPRVFNDLEIALAREVRDRRAAERDAECEPAQTNHMPKITHAFWCDDTTVFTDGSAVFVWEHARADARAAESGQRIIRNLDGSCIIEDLPHEPTALEMVDECLRRWQGESSAFNLTFARSAFIAIRDAILAGNHGGPT